MTFDDFLVTARERYGVTLHRLRTETGVDNVFLHRPARGEQDGLSHPRPRLKLDQRIPSETIARLCRALDMKPADFNLFIG